jgi:hypothetical protein
MPKLNIRLPELNSVKNNLFLYSLAIITTLEMQAIRGLCNELNDRWIKGEADPDSSRLYCKFETLQYDYYYNIKASRPSPWFSLHFNPYAQT